MSSSSENTATANPHTKRNLPPFERVALVLFFLLTPLLCLLYGTILRYTYRLFQIEAPTALYVLRPGEDGWYLPGLFLAIGTVGLYIKLLHKPYLSIKFKPSFMVPDYSRHPMEGFRFIKILAWVLTLVCLFFIAHAFDSYILVYKDRIVINEFLHVGKRDYQLQDIRKLELHRFVDNEGFVSDSNYIIKFTDHYQYNSRDNIFDKNRIFPYLSQASGTPIDTVYRREKD